MLADVAKELDQRGCPQPIRVVHHSRGVGYVGEVEKSLELAALPSDVFVHVRLAQQRALGALAARIADQAGAAPNEDDRGAPRTLEVCEEHDEDEIADLEAWCGGVESPVPGNRAPCQALGQTGRHVMDQAAPRQLFDQCIHRGEGYETHRALASRIGSS